MGVSPILLIGPFVAIVGLVSIIFVMRHRSVQTKSMYSARRTQIERKVRAARQRTLAPSGRHSGKEAAQVAAPDFSAPGMEGKTAVPTATWGAPAGAPTAPPPPPPPPYQQPWEVGPTAPPPSPPTFEPAPSQPTYEPPPSPPTYEPPPEPAYTPPTPEPTYPDSTWTPEPAPPVAPSTSETAVSTPAGGGASWEVVGPAPGAAPQEAGSEKKSKKGKAATATGAWQLASGAAPGTESDEEEVKRPSAAMAIAQYAVLVVGLVMVLIGVLVMVANSYVR
jgi:hypothetical protein